MAYEVELIKASFEPTARERLKYRDFSEMQKIDQLCEGSEDTSIIEGVADYLLFNVHNDNSTTGNEDYSQLVIITEDGSGYVTGSTTFIRDFGTVFAVMSEDNEKPFDIKIRKVPSKRYSGKYFLKLSVL